MTHDDMRLLLAEYAAGQLDSPNERAVREHLDACVDCRESVAAWHTLALTRDSHVGSSLLVAAAIQRETLDAGQTARVEQHLANCEPCRNEFRAIQAADRDALNVPRARRGSGWRWVSLAASVMLAVLLVRELIPSGRPSLPDVDHAFELPVLRGGARGGEAVPIFSPRKSDRMTPLAVVPSLPADLPAQAELLFELHNEQTVVYSLHSSVEEVHQLSLPSQALVLLVPTERLRPGRHRLTLRRLNAEGLLLEAVFEVRPRGEE